MNGYSCLNKLERKKCSKHDKIHKLVIICAPVLFHFCMKLR